MRISRTFSTFHLTLLLACTSWSQAATKPEDILELQGLRQEIESMRSEYEARIAHLEQRLDAAEQIAADAKNSLVEKDETNKPEVGLSTMAASSSIGGAASGDHTFNPAIGVIFQGQTWAGVQEPDDYHIPGFPLGGEAGPLPQGFSLAETEIDISANVDDKFTAWLTLPIVVEDSEVVVEIEEAWIETLSLPAGLSVRMGRFFSNIGYLNDKHSHGWDFADQALAYQVFLGSQYLDDGLQFRWLAPTDFYLELGAEVLRGDRYPAGGARHSGVGSYTLGLKTGGDVGISHSWQAGLSWLSADTEDRPSGSETEPLLFTGDSDLLIAALVWKWSPNGNSRQRNFKFQAEYLWREEDGVYQIPDAQELPWNNKQEGWYAQMVFQPFPRWRVGARMEQLSSRVSEPWFVNTGLETGAHDPRRYSLMVDWSNSEFSRLRLQYNLDDAGTDNDQQFGLQYIHSIGAHGAHSF